MKRIVGRSAALLRFLHELERIRRSEAAIFISGETGTGKELVARVLHDCGPRAEKPFIAFNCAGVTESLVQSTLFGHTKGAFTGADRDAPGLFREADGGTLFLDEVAELTPAVQASLLRVLQEREVVPVGATRPTPIDVRVISATHSDLRRAVEAGNWRRDLYYRLVVISVELPPLRDRSGDIPILAQHFLRVHCDRYGRKISGFSQEAIDLLEAYEWPGNVRELSNEIERLVVLMEDNHQVSPRDLSPHVQQAGAPANEILSTAEGVLIPYRLGYDEAVTTLERNLVERALRRAGGVISRAAAELRMERTRLTKLGRRLDVIND